MLFSAKNAPGGSTIEADLARGLPTVTSTCSHILDTHPSLISSMDWLGINTSFVHAFSSSATGQQATQQNLHDRITSLPSRTPRHQVQKRTIDLSSMLAVLDNALGMIQNSRFKLLHYMDRINK